MRHRLAFLFPFFIFGVSAYAETISFTDTTGPIVSTTDGGSPYSFSQFNSALGSLDSVTVSVSGAYTALNYTLLNFGNSASGTGSGTTLAQGVGNLNISNTTEVDQIPFSNPFEGNGSVTFLLSTIGSYSTPNFTLTLGYNYTPAAVPPSSVTPEPSSLLLLGTGLIAGVGVIQRRSSAT